MTPRCSRKEIGFARLAAEAEAPMLVVDEPELSATICAAILEVAHKTLRYFGGGLHLAGTRLSGFVASIPKRDLLPWAKYLFVRAMVVALLPCILKWIWPPSRWRKEVLPVWPSRAPKAPACRRCLFLGMRD